MRQPTRPALEPTVERLVGRSIDRVGDVRRDPLEYDAFLAGRTLVRVRGVAESAGRPLPWTFIEKVTDSPSTVSAYLYDNGLRELRAYRSGLLDDLAPGLHAPALLASDDGPDGRLTLWIEDLAADGRPPITFDVLVRAARHLGRLAGRWAGRVPPHDWLFRGWIDRHRQPHAVEEGAMVVAAARDDDAVDARIGRRLREALRMIEDQEAFATVLARLPATLCHHDAVAANVFARRRGGQDETVLIDWESVGPGPIGADLASLLFSSARRGDITARWLPELLPAALAAYHDGLSEAGAPAPADEVALGLHASIALRWTLVRDIVTSMSNARPIFRGSAPHEQPEEAMDELLELVEHLLSSANLARGLIGIR